MHYRHSFAILMVTTDDKTRHLFHQALHKQPQKHIVIETASSTLETLDRITELEEDDIELGILIIENNGDEITTTELLNLINPSHPQALKILLTPDIQQIFEALNQFRLFGALQPPYLTESFSRLVTDAIKIFEENWSQQLQIDQLKKQLSELEEKLSERTTELLKKNLQLEQLSKTDSLTQLPNRMKLDEQFHQAINQSRRYRNSLSVLLLDIDHFKRVNDEFGHQIGDEVLIELSQLLKDNIRETDTVGRWGGEEFLIICPNLDLDHAKQLAEKLRHKIAEHDFPVVGHKTASFGLAQFRPTDNEDSLLERADQALYKAKESGRNRVETH